MIDFEVGPTCRGLRWLQVSSWIWLVALVLLLPAFVLESSSDPFVNQSADAFFLLFAAVAGVSGLLALVGLWKCQWGPPQTGSRFVILSTLSLWALFFLAPLAGAAGVKLCITLSLAFFMLFLMRLAAVLEGARLTGLILVQLALLLVVLASPAGPIFWLGVLWLSLAMPYLLDQVVRVLQRRLA